MGIAPYKTFTFDGESSADYGIYITGEGVFNSPERAVDIIDIPSRNGAYALDQGKFNNIQVTYKAGIVDYNETNFAEKVSDARNWLCSKIGYQRLEDEYNPDEYRMALYMSGVSVEHIDLKTGEFDITFECKPQRWLKSGESVESVSDGDTITNPTLFDSSPLLEVKGYGGIGFNGYSIEVEDVTIGTVYIADSDTFTEASKTYTFDTSLFNVGDAISISGRFSGTNVLLVTGGDMARVTSQSASDTNASFITDQPTFPDTLLYELTSPFATSFGGLFTAGTDKTIINTATITANYLSWDHGNGVATFTRTETIAYDASEGTITVTGQTTRSSTLNNVKAYWDATNKMVTIRGNSTVSALGNPTYIDCEIGEAYMFKNGEIMSCNSAVNLGSDLPKLSSGVNTISFDNTITDLKMATRWWKV